jgi:hypothetical protein
MTIGDYCASITRGDIVTDRNYQRSEQVWPPMAKSYLIESIVLDYPLPKFFLHQLTDVRTRQAVKHIVDGQQRSQAIIDFYSNTLRLSENLETDELCGRNYEELDEESRQKFLDYGLSIDLLTAATTTEVIEVFRRMNSYTVPLNPEEKRHAVYQGEFKWFINRFAKKLQPTFRSLGTFAEKQFIRMQDAKLLAEIADAYTGGITTTNSKKLDDLYKKFDPTFEAAEEFDESITGAIEHVVSWPEIHGGPLVKPYQMYALLLAVAHVISPIDHLQLLFESRGADAIERETAVPALSQLSNAIDQEDEEGEFGQFVLASTSKTNVKAQRETRFRWFCRALSGGV